jgi:hypothetical protein
MSFSNFECDGGYCDNDPVMPTCQAYAGPGGACPLGIECDVEAGLSCVDMTCLMAPFPDGTACFDGSQCESQVCFGGVCTAGTAAGGACATDGTIAPCVVGSFCETAAGAVDGTCAELRRPGQACDNSSQCWGECIVRYGQQMCDSTPAFSLNEVWCDGP